MKNGSYAGRRSIRTGPVGAGTARPVREAAVVPPIRCAAPFPLLRRPDVSLRGPKGAVAISGRHCRFVPTAVKSALALYGRGMPRPYRASADLTAVGTNRQCLPEIATAPLGPRNDTSGRRSNGNGAAHRIGGTTAASRTGLAVPAPTGPVRIERRPAYDPFFILQYSLFIISSIPLRGMANHMTKRPEIPCLSCKFPQSRRICH